jgi:hypothetical protein
VDVGLSVDLGSKRNGWLGACTRFKEGTTAASSCITIGHPTSSAVLNHSQRLHLWRYTACDWAITLHEQREQPLPEAVEISSLQSPQRLSQKALRRWKKTQSLEWVSRLLSMVVLPHMKGQVDEVQCLCLLQTGSLQSEAQMN